jgi:hypothetical protein
MPVLLYQYRPGLQFRLISLVLLAQRESHCHIINSLLIVHDIKDDFCSLKTPTTEAVLSEIKKLEDDGYTRVQSAANENGKVAYIIEVSKAGSLLTFNDGNRSSESKSD